MQLSESRSDHGVLPSIFSVPFGSERLSLASVGDQQNGMPFSAISALTRLGRPLGGGGPARSFAEGPRDRGARADDRSMSMRRPERSEYVAIGQRLVGLLPMRANSAEPGREQASTRIKKYFHAVMLLVCFALGAAVFSGML
jgi:hypothetical protein